MIGRDDLPAPARDGEAADRGGEGPGPPLCVDLDGTLISGDLLWESAALLARERPLDLLRMPGWLLGGRAHLKRRIADRARPDPGGLPYRPDVLEYIRGERAKGRVIALVTAADETLARAVAEHLGLFDLVIASDGRNNFKGRRKVAAIRDRFGSAEFDYIGDSAADLAVWRESRRILVVAPGPALLRRVGRLAAPHRIFEGGGAGGRARALSRLLRPRR